jgi:hypothetical protein
LWTVGLYPQDLQQLDIFDQAGSIASVDERAANGIYLRPFGIPALVGIVLLVLLDVRPKLLLPLSIMLGCSLIAPLVVYPAIHTLGASLLLITMLCQWAALWGFTLAVQAVKRRRNGVPRANMPS